MQYNISNTLKLFLSQGLDKHALLDEVLTEVGKSIHCQRLYTEFRDQLTNLQALAKAKASADKSTESGKPIYKRSYSANIASIVGNTGDPSCRSYPGNVFIERNIPGGLPSDKVNACGVLEERINPSDCPNNLRIHPGIAPASQQISSNNALPERTTSSNIADNVTAMNVDLSTVGTNAGDVLSSSVDKALERVGGNNDKIDASSGDSALRTSPNTVVSERCVQRSLEGGNQKSHEAVASKNTVHEPMEVTPIFEPKNEGSMTLSNVREESKSIEQGSKITTCQSESIPSNNESILESSGVRTNSEMSVLVETNITVGPSQNVKENDIKTTVANNAKLSDVAVDVVEKTDRTGTSHKTSISELNKSSSEPVVFENQTQLPQTDTEEKSNFGNAKKSEQNIVDTAKTSAIPSSFQDKPLTVDTNVKETSIKSNPTLTNPNSNEISNTVKKSDDVLSNKQDIQANENNSQTITGSPKTQEAIPTGEITKSPESGTNNSKNQTCLNHPSSNVNPIKTPANAIVNATPTQTAAKTNATPSTLTAKSNPPTPIAQAKPSAQVTPKIPPPIHSTKTSQALTPKLGPASVKQQHLKQQSPQPSNGKPKPSQFSTPASRPAPASVKQSLASSQTNQGTVKPQQSPTVQASKTLQQTPEQSNVKFPQSSPVQPARPLQKAVTPVHPPTKPS